MIRATVLLCLLLLTIAWPAVAEDKQESVPDLIQVIELDAPHAEVWKAFTTAETAKEWMAPVVEIDLRSGGSIKTNYDTKAGIGGPGTIVHNIVALDAPHLVVAQTTAPEGNPFRGVIEEVTGTWRFEPLGPSRTRITLGMHDWPVTKQSRNVRGFFEQANPGVLAKLKQMFPDRPSNADVMKRMQTIIGRWDAELTIGERELLIRKEIKAGPGGKGLISTTSFGPEGKRRLHKHEQVWVGADGRIHFRALDDRGGSVAGVLRCDGDDDVIWDFVDKGKATRLRMSTGAGKTHRFAVQMRGEDGTYTEAFHVDYRRVD